MTKRDGVNYFNTFIIQGPESDLYSVKNVPHGTLSIVWYESPTLKLNRRMYVYTPPGYVEGKEKYPVLYLLHGAGGDEDAWTANGLTPIILDNLIAQGKAKPMIVVMTNGNPGESVAIVDRGPAASKQGGPGGGAMSMNSESFPESLVKDVIPYIEKNYRVISNSSNRAIAGLSMGCLHTQITVMNNPDMFKYIGLFSLGLHENLGDVNKRLIAAYDKNLPKLKENYKLMYVAVGKEDFVFEGVQALRKKLDQNNFKYIYNESTGGHTWSNWRIYLSELAPQLFK
ncbi:MAG: alpha/beta hydrolase [Flavitalea sp.]